MAHRRLVGGIAASAMGIFLFAGAALAANAPHSDPARYVAPQATTQAGGVNGYHHGLTAGPSGDPYTTAQPWASGRQNPQSHPTDHPHATAAPANGSSHGTRGYDNHNGRHSWDHCDW